ncbi:alcohol dehydrogenase catalytic domain-containing protein [Nocardia vermiculata]|uniref:Alcohol dehydrogenase catalytic domain-containing protein n=1 Tax=Nocardia vermiculata TaxID=257274 RepID=A0A846Y4S3_9NOCA|nr:alcohol dehydrogenase catalytic domain-containing protein [Nocardia vermiculata]NKY52711.1 alcohol dehydrogenase catalytic domain-containing protein [Nocardia vermiculata]
MKAVTWQGRRNVSVDEVPDPRIQEPTDAIIAVSSSGLCGSDLHLYEVLGPYMSAGDILGHEPIGVVVEVGAEVRSLAVGDRVVVPFQIACGHCVMCESGLPTQCETTQVREYGSGAALFGYSKLYGQVPGAQAQYLRVPHADFTHISIPAGPDDSRFLYLSDVLPTAWQAVEYAGVPDGGSLVVLGLGPIGDMACRIGAHRGYRVIGVDRVPERLRRVSERGIETVDSAAIGDATIGDVIRDRTDGRGPDSVVDAVGMEAHGSPVAEFAQRAAGYLPDSISERLLDTAAVDRLAALDSAIDIVRRGGTISLSGVYGGMMDPLPMRILFDKQIQLRMGQANVKRWVGDLLPLLADGDPLGVESFATHRLPLSSAPRAYRDFQRKADGMVKVVLDPAA